MTSPKLSDPLLTGAKGIIIFVCAILGFAMVMVGIGTVAAPTVGKVHILAEFAKVGVPPEGVWLIAGTLLLVAVLLGIALKFMLTLLEIVNTVGEGDPFQPENGKRLQLMGWLGFAGQLIILPLATVEHWFRPYLEKAGKHEEIGFGLDLGTILLILILFILARVFRKGAAMREELEGTV